MISSTNLQHGTFRQFGEERIEGNALFVNLASCGEKLQKIFQSLLGTPVVIYTTSPKN